MLNISGIYISDNHVFVLSYSVCHRVDGTHHKEPQGKRKIKCQINVSKTLLINASMIVRIVRKRILKKTMGHTFTKKIEDVLKIRGDDMSEIIQVPICDKYTLTVSEAIKYFNIGENKLRTIANEHSDSDFILMCGNRILFKRKKFEDFLDKCSII